ncbi:DUF418 domain-containing protein [Erythrobacter sp.]|jgi:uncharacterized protein|uniref:DUF418 domain-containing protein n=1 Tax=Erythrobacter sp. TaxID=1042 RepID=UPI002EAAA627|nr:DUF418 domain-containing protein [Erythrobacter sp.]
MGTPLHPTSRIVELDALRGLAVIGIVWMNVHVFALPSQAYYNPQSWGPGIGEASSLDRLVWAASFVFVEDKFRTLFAMLFGAGCLILLERTGERPWRAHYARMAVLFAMGLAHSILFASNDILRAYAIAACALPLLAALSHRALFAVAIGLVAVHFGAGMVAMGSAVVDVYAGRIGSDAHLFAERNFGLDPAAIAHSLEQGREGLGERMVRRSGNIGRQLVTVAGSLPLNLAAMALGMGLWKARMLAGEWRTFLLQRLAAICALLALPPLFALAWWVADSGFSGAFAGAASLVLSAPFDTLLGLAYAALAMALFSAGGAVTRRLAAAGRLALTNYLLSSLILAAVFASWGLGLFGAVSRSEALALSFVPVAIVLALSPVWLARFGQGPAERLWRMVADRLA